MPHRHTLSNFLLAFLVCGTLAGFVRAQADNTTIPAVGRCVGREKANNTWAAVCTMDATQAASGIFTIGDTTTRLALQPKAVAPNMVKFLNTDPSGSWTGVYGQSYVRFTELLVYNVPFATTSVQVSTNFIARPEGETPSTPNWATCNQGPDGNCLNGPSSAGDGYSVFQVTGLSYDCRVFWSIDLYY